MATTSLWQVSGAPAAVLKYAANPEKTDSGAAADPQKQIGEVMRYTARDEKTDGRLLVTGVRCSPDPEKAAEEFMQTKRAWGKTGGVACFHGYQSFAKGEVTPEQAHEIGVEYAKRVWGDRFEVLVTTHIDKDSHIHNHVVVNSVSVVDGKKYDNSHADRDRMMSISDEICREHGLSVIEKPKGRTRQYGEWLADQADRSTQRDEIRSAIDRALSQTWSFRDFCRIIENDGYVLERRGSFLRIRPDEGRKFFRLDRLGEGYTEDDIYERLKQNFHDRPRPPRPTFVYRKREKAKGLYALYLHYMYLLGNLPESRPTSRETYVMMREDSKRLQMYSDESKLLAANRIVTAEDLAGYVASITSRYDNLSRRRAGLRNKLRHMTDSEAMRPIKDQIAALSDDMAKIRRERKLCEDVAARCEIVEYIADTIEKEHTPQTQNRTHSPRNRNDAR